MKYDGTKWVVSDDAGGIGDVTNPGNHFRQVGSWVAGTVENLNNVAASGTLPGQVLGYDGANWTNQDVPLEAPIDGLKYARKDEAWEEVKDYRNLNDLEDVDPSALADNKILKWNATASKYVLADDGQGIPDAPSDTVLYS